MTQRLVRQDPQMAQMTERNLKGGLVRGLTSPRGRSIFP